MALTIDQWLAGGLNFHHGTNNIFYRDSGDINKPAILLIHGFPTSSWDWHKITPALLTNHRVVTLDLLGFGFSDKPHHHTYSIDSQCDIIEGLLNHLNIKDYHLVAHDFSTLIAQELLARRHNAGPKILSLFAMSGSIFPELSNPRLIQKILISKFGFILTRLIGEELFYKSLKQVFATNTQPTESDLKNHWRLLCHNGGNHLLHRLNYFVKDRILNGERWATAWQSSDVPIRYIIGFDDPMYGGQVIEALTSLSKQKDIHTLANVGHFPHLEAPEQTTKLLLAFISGQQTPINKQILPTR